MANLDNLISKLNNAMQNELDESISRAGSSSVFWAGNAAGIYKKYLNHIVNGNLLTLTTIKKQVDILNNEAALITSLRNDMQTLVNYKAEYYGLREANRIDPERVSYHVVNVAEYNYSTQEKKVNANINAVVNNLKQITSKSLSQPSINYKECDGYYVDMNPLVVHAAGLLGTIIPELNRLTAEINSLKLVDSIELFADVDSSSYIGAPYRHHSFKVNVSKRLGFVTARNILLKNIEKIKIYVDKLCQRIENHTTRILEFENGKNAEELMANYTEFNINAIEDPKTDDKKEVPQESVEVQNNNSASKYVTQPGDSLSKIAAKYGMSWEKLYEANKDKIGSNPNMIYSGMTLTIPAISGAVNAATSIGENNTPEKKPQEQQSNSTSQKKPEVQQSNSTPQKKPEVQQSNSTSSGSYGIFDQDVEEQPSSKEPVSNEGSSKGEADNLVLSPVQVTNDRDVLPADWKSPYPNEYPNNQRIIYNALKAEGYNDAVIAGIMGNIQQECHYNTASYTSNDSGQGPGGGLVGWLYKYYPEAQNLRNGSAQEQVDYLIYTLNNPIDGTVLHKNDLMNIPNTHDGAIQAANLFRSKYEKTGSAAETRRTYASNFYESFTS